MKATGRVAWSIPIALAPLIIHTAPTFFGMDTVFDGNTEFFGAFLVAGIVAGGTLGFLAALGAPIAYIIGMFALTRAGFVGAGGDGDLFYVAAGLGSGLTLLSALAAALARMAIARVGRPASCQASSSCPFPS